MNLVFQESHLCLAAIEAQWVRAIKGEHHSPIGSSSWQITQFLDSTIFCKVRFLLTYTSPMLHSNALYYICVPQITDAGSSDEHNMGQLQELCWSLVNVTSRDNSKIPGIWVPSGRKEPSWWGSILKEWSLPVTGTERQKKGNTQPCF